ncbi:SRPBCC family protein [Fimbriimonas ginsengisoli]|uniref:Hsp90 ATPase activator family protein, putative n=1 Tax=Fimbriimonas ginsengisoli Gsoil 348 TaxID=661478 RepID=A0A068NPI1_FIMGI|nr:SRPBCC domain-containing protein [Fimbriimonas ginsengisoli]AIE85356.1 Hsp90 ATPase activator family protein, putative [Fimbriimonas ginsengisoli Gsoil 348]
MNEKLTFEAFYPHPPSRVWEALTDAKALAHWLMPTDFQPRIGFRFSLEGHTRGSKAKVKGEVIELEVAKLLRYTWDDGEAGSPSVVTWNLQPQDGGTLVRLEHASTIEVQPYVLIEANLNWRYAMYASLPVLLTLLREGRFRPPVPMVYCPDEPEAETGRRAGFRQEPEVVAR